MSLLLRGPSTTAAVSILNLILIDVQDSLQNGADFVVCLGLVHFDAVAQSCVVSVVEARSFWRDGRWMCGVLEGSYPGRLDSDWQRRRRRVCYSA